MKESIQSRAGRWFGGRRQTPRRPGHTHTAVEKSWFSIGNDFLSSSITNRHTESTCITCNRARLAALAHIATLQFMCIEYT